MNPSVKPSACWITNTYFNSKFAENTDGFSVDAVLNLKME